MRRKIKEYFYYVAPIVHKYTHSYDVHIYIYTHTRIGVYIYTHTLFLGTGKFYKNKSYRGESLTGVKLLGKTDSLLRSRPLSIYPPPREWH